MYEDLEELCETLTDELHEANSKLRNGKMNSGDLEYIDKLTHALKSVTILKEMEGESHDESYDDGSYRSRRSYENSGRRSYRRRDSMGRYSRDNEELMRDLQQLADKAPDPQTKAEIQKFMRTMGG